MTTTIMFIVLCLTLIQITFSVADYIDNDRRLKRLNARVKALEEKNK